MTVHAVDPRSDPRWLRLVCAAGGSLFTSPPWIRALCDAYGFSPTARVLTGSGGVPRSGHSWIDVDDIRGRRRLSLPFCDRADPILARAEDWAEVSRDALNDDVPYTVRCLAGSAAAADPRLGVTSRAASHVTPLTAPLDEIRQRFRPQTRRNIATADRAGLEVVLTAEAAAVGEYHRLHVALRKNKYRLLAQPRCFFDAIWRAFAATDSIRTALALVDGRPVAAAIYLIWLDTIYYKFGASDPQHLRLRPNDALHWAVLQWAHARGLRSLDWGLSDLSQPGLVAYKRKWATVEGSIVSLRSAHGPAEPASHADRTLHDLTMLLTESSVDDELTARAGALLYRYFC